LGWILRALITESLPRVVWADNGLELSGAA